MCGRFILRELDVQFIYRFEPNVLPKFTPRYNIAPSQNVFAVRNWPPEIASMRWGLIPSWAKDISISYKMINARAESIAEKPSFRSAFQKRRCLILAD